MRLAKVEMLPKSQRLPARWNHPTEFHRAGKRSGGRNYETVPAFRQVGRLKSATGAFVDTILV